MEHLDMEHRDHARRGSVLGFGLGVSIGLTAILFAGMISGCDDTTTTGPGIECGAGTQEVDGVCVADPVEIPLQPEHYLPPLVQLQRAQGDQSHMHVSQVKYREADAKLFYCSYTFGMIDASNPQRLRYQVQNLRHETPSGSPRTPGCLHLAWDEDNPNLIYTSHRGNIDFAVFLSGWDLTDLSAPVQLEALQEPGTSYGGVDVENGLVYVALQEEGLGIYDYDMATGWTRIATATGLANAWNVKVIGNTAYVADGIGGLATVDVTDPFNPTFIARMVYGGSSQDLVVDDGIAYVAAGGAGLVLVDVSDPAAPTLVSSASTPGSAVGVGYSAGRAYVAAWNDTRVFDVSDRSLPRFIAALRLTTEKAYELCTGDPEVCVPDGGRPDPTARTLHVTAHNDIMFVGNWWVPYSFQVHDDRMAPYAVLPEDFALVDFGPAAPGETNTRQFVVRNDGTAPLTLFDNWIDNPAFTVSPRQARIEPGASRILTLDYSATSTEREAGILSIWTDDPLQPLRTAHLVGNQPGLGVGKPLPDTVVTLFDGSTLSTSAMTGSVMLLAYFATF